MNLKKNFIAILILVLFAACTSQNNQKAEEKRLDSIRNADSVAAILEQQRLIDSVNMVSKEQQIIADSIRNQVTN